MNALQNLTTVEVAKRFHELAQQEKWFDIQVEFFADHVKSIDPPGSPFFGCAEGLDAVRRKGEEFLKKVTAIHGLSTTAPIVAGNRFAVGREMDITVEGHGRIQLNEIMLYQVENGKIVVEEFVY